MTESNRWGPSTLVSSFEESATLLLGAKAKRLAQEGKSIVNFGVGEPDFNTPEPIIHSALKAALAGQTKYTAVGGILSLRKAIAEKTSQDYGIKFGPEEVLVSAGGKQAIFHFLQSIIEPLDEVLILSPYWVSFPEMVKLVGGRPVIVRPSSGDRVTARDIQEKISAKTKCLILNSPSNPSGQVLNRAEIESYLKVIEPHSIWLLSDDTYYELVYAPAQFVSGLQVDEKNFRQRTCIIGSASKTYAMTGWRLGWGIAPTPIIQAMTKLQSQVTSSACSLSQVAAEVAIRSFQTTAEEFRLRFEKRRDLMLDCLKKIPDLRLSEPEGAFYIFVDFSKALKRKKVAEYAEILLEKSGVCIIPGVAFGEPDYARLSYALSDADIREGVRRIGESLRIL